MATLTVARSLSLVSSLAKRNAPAGLEAQYEAEGEQWVHAVFGAITKNGDPIDEWSSIEPQSRVLPASSSYGYARIMLRNAVAQYVNEMPWLHCQEFNWLLANTLLHAEVSATALAFGYVPDAQLVALKLLWKLFVWGAWLAILAALLLFDLPWAAGAWLALTLARVLLKWRHRKARNRLIASMVDAYHSTNSMALSWNIVWDAMITSRDLGAVWDQELYQLVELLRSTCPVQFSRAPDFKKKSETA